MLIWLTESKLDDFDKECKINVNLFCIPFKIAKAKSKFVGFRLDRVMPEARELIGGIDGFNCLH
jgi:hypothetical protein